MSQLGHSRLARDHGRSSHFRCAPIATEFCDAIKYREVPIADSRTAAITKVSDLRRQFENRLREHFPVQFC
jgi:hypothetical protein